MERTYINEVQKEIGSTVKVQGFIENLRNSSRVRARPAMQAEMSAYCQGAAVRSGWVQSGRGSCYPASVIPPVSF